MRLRHIEVFHAIKQTGSISKAAALLGISQPAASKILHHAETALGFRLFDRVRGRLQPTAEAEALHIEVAKLHNGLEHLRRLSVNLRRFPDGRLHIGCLPSLGLAVMPKVIHEFRLHYPAVICDVETEHIDAILDALRARRLDMALALTIFTRDHPGIRTQALGETELVYFGPDPGGDIAIEDIDISRIVGLSRTDKIGELFVTAFEAAGGIFKPPIEVQTYFLACALAAQGCGGTIVDALTAQSMLREGLFIRRIRPRLPIEIALLAHEYHVGRGFYADLARIIQLAIREKDINIRLPRSRLSEAPKGP
jgi:DNA-binding transcriptional LysR family regulator